MLLVAQPTRGLDVGSIEFIHKRIVEMRDAGTAVLLVSAELDEILTLSDRIGVLYRGELVGEFDGRRDTRTCRPADGVRPAHPSAADCGMTTGPSRPVAEDKPSPPRPARTSICSRCSCPICAILLAFAVGSVIILLVGKNPIDVYWALLRGMWAPDRIAGSLGRSTPFIGAALARRVRLPRRPVQHRRRRAAARRRDRGRVGRHVGLDRRPARGARGARRVARRRDRGAVYGAIPGVLKARTGAHEVITTIMLNWIAVLYIRWLVGSQDPVILRDMTASVPRTAIPAGGRPPPDVRP